MPVSHAAATHHAVVERETERTYEMQARVGENAGAADGSRIGGYLGLKQDDVEHAVYLP